MQRAATQKIVRIDALPESAWRCEGYDAIVLVDVLLSATTLLTALSLGRRVVAARSAEHALQLKSRLADALVFTDTPEARDDSMPSGGPAWLDGALETSDRPLVLVSALGEMLAAAPSQSSVYVACLRNLEATASRVARQHSSVAILAVGERGELCAADQMVASWLAERLRRQGFELEGRTTTDEVQRWGSADSRLIGWSRSAERLRACGRADDVEYVLAHVDDLDVVCSGSELGAPSSSPAARSAVARPALARPAVAWRAPARGTPLSVQGV